MLLLLFQINEAWLGLDARQVLEVVPHVPLASRPGMPACMAGWFAYRGGPAPVLDLGLLWGAAPCRRRLSTRIILVPSRQAGSLGLLAESVTGMIHARAEEFRRGQVQPEGAPSPGPIRCLRTEELLAPEAERELFAAAGG
jgi:chemotaxis signal transduction protein